MQGLDVKNKDWVSWWIPSTVNLLLLVSQWKFHKPMETQGKSWKNPGTEAFLAQPAVNQTLCVESGHDDLEVSQT